MGTHNQHNNHPGQSWGEGTSWKRRLGRGCKEQAGFGEERGFSRLWKEMKGLGLLVTLHKESPSCPVLCLKTNTGSRADSAHRG